MANPSERDMETKGVLILLRHGMSIWNRDPSKKNQVWRYAGSVDIPLSKTGIEEACEAAESIQHIPITAAYTSNLSRAQVTAQIVLCENCSAKVPLLIPDSSDLSSQISGIHGNQARESVLPVYCRAELNERSFGLLEGVDCTDHKKMYTEEELINFRNSFCVPFPQGESSKDVFDRVIPFFESEVLPQLVQGENVIISSHGFVIRTLVKYLEGMTDEEWEEEMKIEKSIPEQCRLLAPTGRPLVYHIHNTSEQTVFMQLRSDDAA